MSTATQHTKIGNTRDVPPRDGEYGDIMTKILSYIWVVMKSRGELNQGTY
jgi:hypothetical protein